MSRKRKTPRRVPPPAGDGLVALHTLPPGATFRTPDWPACTEWPEAIKGWAGRVVYHSPGSSTVARDGDHLAVSLGTRVVDTRPAPAPPAPAPTP